MNVLQKIQEIQEKHPHLRIGQIVVLALPPHYSNDPFYISDAELLNNLVKLEQSLVSVKGKQL